MTEIYLIRHVQAEGNLYRVIQGNWDGGVTPMGRLQGQALAERFRDVHVDAVYSSDLYRARFTAAAVADSHGLPVISDKRFREINLGTWEGRFFGDLKYNDAEMFNNFLRDQYKFGVEGSETYIQVAERICPALRDLAERHPDQTIAIASHAVALRCLLCSLFGIDMRDTESVPMFKNTGVARLLFDGKDFTLDYLNDCSHLPQELQISGKDVLELRHEYIDPSEHQDYYKHCYEQAWLFAHGDLSGFDPGVYLSCAREHHSNDSEAVLRLWYKDESAGLIDLDTMRGSHAGYGWISLLYLEPEFRHKGCGIQLLARAILKYSAMGRKALRLHVAEENTAALAFYRRWGFEILSEEPGSHGKLLLMEKKLGGPHNV